LKGLMQPVGELLRVRAPTAVGAGEVRDQDSELLGKCHGRPAGHLPPDVSPAALTIRVETFRSASMSGTYPPFCRISCAMNSSKFPAMRAPISRLSGVGSAACISSLYFGPPSSTIAPNLPIAGKTPSLR
jgi:hypothetical protein